MKGPLLTAPSGFDKPGFARPQFLISFMEPKPLPSIQPLAR
jgi:hypothetical protein